MESNDIESLKHKQEIKIERTSLAVIEELQDNRLNDLKRFLKKRECISTTNWTLNILFHFIQSSGIFLVFMSNSYESSTMLYSGVCLNVLASIISGVVQLNTKVSQKMLSDIKNIRSNDYIDEGVVNSEAVTQ